MKLKFLSIIYGILICMIGANSGIASEANSQEKPFVIVVPSYNNKEWYKKNLDSLFSQKYNNFRIIYTDDCSPDGTGELVKAYIKEKGQERRVKLVINQERQGSLANLYTMISQCEKGDVIVDLDGDDWLAHDEVLAYLNQLYSDPEVWMTYGQYTTFPGNYQGIAAQVPQEVIEKNTFRTFEGAVTHLRTFYAGLFHKIKKEDLLYEGSFLSIAGDVAFLVPVCELAGKHSRFVPDVLYVYNVANPINDHKIDRNLQVKMNYHIRSKEKYQPLASYL